MKKFLIPVLSIMLLLPFMYGGCLDSATDDILSQIPTVPSLAGTWGGPGWVDQQPVPTRLSAERTVLEDCTTLPFVDVQIVTDEAGKVTDVTLCGESLAAWEGTIDGTVTGGGAADKYLTYAFTTTTSEGTDVFQGGLVFDWTTGGDVYGFFWLDKYGEGWENFAEALVQLDGGALPTYTESDLYDDWSGFEIQFTNGTPDGYNFVAKWEPIDIAITAAPASFWIDGTGSSGETIEGDGQMDNTFSSWFWGGFDLWDGDTFLEEVDIEGYLSADKNVIAGWTEPTKGGGSWDFGVFMYMRQ